MHLNLTSCFVRVEKLSIGAISLALFVGCASKKKTEEIWVPSPRVHWEDLSQRSIDAPTNQNRILTAEATKGMFPASMAVTRLSIHEVAEMQSREPVLVTDPRNEFLQWNSSLDDKMAVSEVFPIFPRDLGGNPANPDQILAAFRALDARLGLIYAVNELSPTETEAFGVLYDVKAAAPIAAIHAKAESILIPETEKEPTKFDLWKTDSRALARAKFEDSLRQCVRDLISRDQPTELESAEGWKRLSPTRPVEWPPNSPQ